MSVKRRGAVFTIQQNEKKFLPVWYKYYLKHFSVGDIFILDHNSNDDTTNETLRHIYDWGSHVVPVTRAESFNHTWLRDTVEAFQRFLLQSYDCVLFAECDEIIATDPTSDTIPSLQVLIEKFSRSPGIDFMQFDGTEVMQGPGEKAINWDDPLLAQRRWWAKSQLYSKVLLSKVPLYWGLGFHLLRDTEQADRVRDVFNGLRLLHLHRLDFNYCLERHRSNIARRWAAEDLQTGRGFQNRIVNEEDLKRWFYHPETMGGDKLIPQPIPDEWKGVL
jgi:Glycosyl transferase family 2